MHRPGAGPGFTGRAGRADDTVSPRRLGEFLGFVLMCECLPYESQHQQAAFNALLVEQYGQDYADTAIGYMHGTMDGFYRNTGTVCSGYVCGNDYTVYLGEILAMIDAEPDDYLAAYGEPVAQDTEPKATPTPSLCAFKPFNPRCKGEP